MHSRTLLAWYDSVDRDCETTKFSESSLTAQIISLLTALAFGAYGTYTVTHTTLKFNISSLLIVLGAVFQALYYIYDRWIWWYLVIVVGVTSMVNVTRSFIMRTYELVATFRQNSVVSFVLRYYAASQYIIMLLWTAPFIVNDIYSYDVANIVLVVPFVTIIAVSMYVFYLSMWARVLSRDYAKMAANTVVAASIGCAAWYVEMWDCDIFETNISYAIWQFSICYTVFTIASMLIMLYGDMHCMPYRFLILPHKFMPILRVVRLETNPNLRINTILNGVV